MGKLFWSGSIDVNGELDALMSNDTDINYYLVGIPSDKEDSEYLSPKIRFPLKEHHIEYIKEDMASMYLDRVIKRTYSSIEWNKANLKEAETKLEKLIKLKEKYK